MKVFLEIGYTNLKFIIDDNEEQTLLSSSSYNLENFLNNFNFDNDKLYILNNNKKFSDLLNSFKHLKNYFLFDHRVHYLDLKINPNIDPNELGDDLRFLIYYMDSLKNKDIVLMSNGSCLVTIVKHNNLINSISINLGLTTSLNVIKDNYGLVTDRSFYNEYATNTNNALALGEYLLFKGILSTTLENFHIKDCLIILCGNGYDKNWINDFQETTKIAVEYKPDLVLKAFRNWCLSNNL